MQQHIPFLIRVRPVLTGGSPAENLMAGYSSPKERVVELDNLNLG